MIFAKDSRAGQISLRQARRKAAIIFLEPFGFAGGLWGADSGPAGPVRTPAQRARRRDWVNSEIFRKCFDSFESLCRFLFVNE
ncbi:hypothetical protein PUN4_1610008 [Paraburkholderia unamae]|nr:hypothetical protein PUN4_1610008 [Paraburkholderia unamae]